MRAGWDGWATAVEAEVSGVRREFVVMSNVCVCVCEVILYNIATGKAWKLTRYGLACSALRQGGYRSCIVKKKKVAEPPLTQTASRVPIKQVKTGAGQASEANLTISSLEKKAPPP